MRQEVNLHLQLSFYGSDRYVVDYLFSSVEETNISFNILNNTMKNSWDKVLPLICKQLPISITPKLLFDFSNQLFSGYYPLKLCSNIRHTNVLHDAS